MVPEAIVPRNLTVFCPGANGTATAAARSCRRHFARPNRAVAGPFLCCIAFAFLIIRLLILLDKI